MNDRDSLTRRSVLQNAGLAAASALAGPAVLSGKDRPPNILFVFSDQQRWDTVDCYGSPLVDNLTPNLDRMASEGVRFQHSFTCQPVCGPARSCLQTGKWATETGCFRNGIALPRGEKTMAHWMSGAGYEVGYLGKWHLASTNGIPGRDFNCRTAPIPPERRGGYKDYWLASDILEFTSHGYGGYMFDASGNKREWPVDQYRVDAQTDWAIEHLRTRKGDQPFFLFLSYIEPHHQNDRKHFEGPHGSKERFKNFRVPGDLQGLDGDWREELPDYLGCCSSLDQNLGRLRGELDRLGIAENTLVIYTCDHGCHFRTRNSEYKRACQDNAIRTPLIIHGPGFTGGKVVEELVSLIDLTPTVLKAGGAGLPPTLRGRPLQDLVNGGVKDWPEDVFVQISESQVGRAIRTKKWKYSVRAPEGQGGKDAASDVYQEDCLYDLEADPDEHNSLAADSAYNDVREKLRATLLRRMAAAGERAPKILPASA